MKKSSYDVLYSYIIPHFLRFLTILCLSRPFYLFPIRFLSFPFFPSLAFPPSSLSHLSLTLDRFRAHCFSSQHPAFQLIPSLTPLLLVSNFFLFCRRFLQLIIFSTRGVPPNPFAYSNVPLPDENERSKMPLKIAKIIKSNAKLCR